MRARPVSVTRTVVAFFVALSALAAEALAQGRPQLAIQRADADLAAETLLVRGEYFVWSNDSPAVVTLAGGPPLAILAVDEAHILAQLPPALAPGAYRLKISRGAGAVQNGTFDVTIGTVGREGPAGPPGPPGPQGEQGIQGIQGERGPQGERGEQGERGLQGEQGIPGVAGPKGDKGDTGEQGPPGTLPAVACPSGQALGGINGDGTPVCLPVSASLIATILDEVGGGSPSITRGSDGRNLISYASGGALMVARCDDVACTSARRTAIDNPPFGVGETAIAVGADGLPLVAYCEITDRIRPRIKVAHCDDAQCTGATATIVDDTDHMCRYPSITIGADGRGLVSYHDQLGENLKVAHCDDVACTAATVTTLDSVGSVGLHTSITIGPLGRGFIAYTDFQSGALKLAFCGNAACTSASVGTIPVAGYATEPSVVMGSTGWPLVAFVELVSRSLKVMRCLDLMCTASPSVATVDGGDVAGDTSIVLGSDGLPLISYHGDSDLRIARCNNGSCSSSTVQTLDAVGNVGSENGIAIAADGFGIIAYLDETNTALKVAHCSNRSCVP